MFAPATSYLIVATKRRDRWFDLDAVREPGNAFDRPEGGVNGSKKRGPDIATHDRGLGDADRVLKHNPAGAPPLDWWKIDPTDDNWTRPEGRQPPMTARYIVGDTREVLRSLPDASVDLVLSSPPFLALRSYLPADHPDKPFEIGSEQTPGAFLDVLLDVVEECARVLSPYGTLAFELGDTYAGGQVGWAGMEDEKWAGRNTFRESSRERKGDGWPLDKSLCMIPSSFAWALAYGRNPWTGRETDKWRVRNVIAWCRPNPPVGALGDKFRPATSYLTVAAKRRDRWFDLDAVREPHAEHTQRYLDGKRNTKQEPQGHNGTRSNPGQTEYYSNGNPAGAPPLDWWEIPTQPYAGSHYATWPEKLCVRPIEAMCPREVCMVCGKPRWRIVETLEPRIVNESDAGKDRTQGRHVGGIFAKSHTVKSAVTQDAGWTDCGCGCDECLGTPVMADVLPCTHKYRRGIVLDPFAGSGTTLAVAEGHGRDSIGIDLDARNADLARERVGMWLSVEEHDREGAA